MLYDELRPKLRVRKSVYKPLEDSRMLGKCVEQYAFGKMLDLGTGTGILGIIGALKGCDVTFADINPEAIDCAKENAKLNGVKGKFIVSDLFRNIKGKFNIITFNAPFLSSKPLQTGRTNPSTDGGINGREVIDAFLANYKKYVLKKHIVFITESYWNKFDEDVKRLNAEIVAKKHYPLLGDCVVLKFN